MRIDHCQMNHLSQPVGYDLSCLRASWRVSETDSTRQRCSRLRVWQERQEIYTTGWRELDSLSTAVPVALKPRTRYTWQVEVEGDAGDAAQSDVQVFETGKQQEPWQGQWVGSPLPAEQPPMLRKGFTLRSLPKQARLYATGLGLYEVYLNGAKLGDEYLLPGLTVYSDCVQVQTFDLTGRLAEGENTLTFLMGEGWYMGRFGLEGKSRHFGDHYALLAEIHLDEQVLPSDGSWEVSPSPVVSSGIYDGEVYDPGRRADWQPCVVLPNERHPTMDRLSPALRVQHRRGVEQVLKTPQGEWVLDFGQNMAGFVEVRCALPKEKTLRLLYGEHMERGRLYRDNLGTAKAEYVYHSDGRSGRLAPHFTYYGFRYVQVEGVQEIHPEDYTACALWSDMEDIGTLHTSNAQVNRLIENTRWGQRSNYVEIPTDCPQRSERMGWTADAQVFAATACFLTDSQGFLRKFCRDMRQEQAHHQGAMPHVVPSFGENGSCSAWGDAATIIPWTLYCFSGDDSILGVQYGSMKAWVDYIRGIDAQTGDHRLWTTGFHFGDWLGLDNEADDGFKGGTEDGYIASAYYYHSASLVSKAAKVLGYAQDAAAYGALAEEVLAALRREYFSPNGRLCITTQCGYVLALWFGLCPCGTEERTARALAEKLKAAKVHLKTGFVGTAYLCKALSQFGLNAMAYRLLLNEDYPSWLYEVNLGATTVWERWNSLLPDGSMNPIQMNSLNHYSYGSIVEWMYRCMAGLRPTEDAPGFRRSIIQPMPDYRLPKVDMTYRSAAGEYAVSYEIMADGSFALDVAVPFGATATLHLPNHPAPVVELKAGRYHTRYQPQPAMVPHYDLQSPLEDLEESEYCLRCLRDAGVQPRQVPPAMHGMNLRQLCDTPFVALSQDALRQLDQALRQNGAQQP